MLLSYTQLGESQSTTPIVVIHGLFGSKENLNVIAKPLADTHHVINIDLRNHGASFHNDVMNYPLMAADVFAVLDHLAIETCIVIGHSMGGKVAMQMALSNKERIEKLLVLDIAPTHYTPRHEQIFSGLKSVSLDSIKTRADADQQLAQYVPEIGVRQFLLKSLAKNDNGFCWRYNLDKIIDSYNDILAKPIGDGYHGPTLFIKGALSDYISEAHRAEIATLFPNAKAKIIAGAGHWLHAEKPSQVNLAIAQFLVQ